jgi:hypothetical protein
MHHCQNTLDSIAKIVYILSSVTYSIFLILQQNVRGPEVFDMSCWGAFGFNLLLAARELSYMSSIPKLGI